MTRWTSTPSRRAKARAKEKAKARKEEPALGEEAIRRRPAGTAGNQATARRTVRVNPCSSSNRLLRRARASKPRTRAKPPTPWRRARPLGSRPWSRLLQAAWTSAASASSRSAELMSLEEQCVDSEGWLRFTFDTGAAITAFPSDIDIGEKVAQNDATYRTAIPARSSRTEDAWP